MHIAVGVNRRRLPLSRDASDATVASMCSAYRAAFQVVFLEFEDGMYMPLTTGAQDAMAAAMVTMHAQRHFDDDGWIREAWDMERATNEHMLAENSASEDDEIDD